MSAQTISEFQSLQKESLLTYMLSLMDAKLQLLHSISNTFYREAFMFKPSVAFRIEVFGEKKNPLSFILKYWLSLKGKKKKELVFIELLPAQIVPELMTLF